MLKVMFVIFFRISLSFEVRKARTHKHLHLSIFGKKIRAHLLHLFHHATESQKNPHYQHPCLKEGGKAVSFNSRAVASLLYHPLSKSGLAISSTESRILVRAYFMDVTRVSVVCSNGAPAPTPTPTLPHGRWPLCGPSA